MLYPLAQNQFINNSPGIFSCIREGANTGATCIRPDMNSLNNLANMRKMIPQKYFPVFTRVRIQTPHVFAQKLIPRESFPACIGFVPGGNPKGSLGHPGVRVGMSVGKSDLVLRPEVPVVEAGTSKLVRRGCKTCFCICGPKAC